MSQRTVFFVSDHSGVTAETLGHSLMTQFDSLDFRKVTVPFVSDLDKARQTVRMINLTEDADGVRPIVFSTLVKQEIRDIVRESSGFFLDFFDSFLAPLEKELDMTSALATGRAHGITDAQLYDLRIEATNFALTHDDGTNLGGYDQADVILVGVSRSGKTPTCLYLALQYGVYAANFPLTEDEFESRGHISTLPKHRARLFGLTIEPMRLEEIRGERRPGSQYASSQQVGFEVRQAEALFRKLGIPHLDTTRMSIEEIASRILDETGLERRTSQ
ncbi:MAG: kinase/pyrophosphorylase [Gemmatimonadota bacterium]|nr:kinase/pyrophosphorylase [Gemmatimonadota bacterium]